MPYGDASRLPGMDTSLVNLSIELRSLASTECLPDKLVRQLADVRLQVTDPGLQTNP